MKKRISIIPLVLIAAIMCASCAGKNIPHGLPNMGEISGEDIEKLKQIESQLPGAAQSITRIGNGINLSIKGDKKLNWYYKKPHALVLCAYQLKDLNGFKQMLEEKNGMAKLMECGRYDSSVNYVKRIVVQPGREIRIAMDLFEGTKNVAVIAGYYNFKTNQAVKSFELPLEGIFKKKPTGMDINLYLKSNEILEIKKD